MTQQHKLNNFFHCGGHDVKTVTPPWPVNAFTGKESLMETKATPKTPELFSFQPPVFTDRTGTKSRSAYGFLRLMSVDAVSLRLRTETPTVDCLGCGGANPEFTLDEFLSKILSIYVGKENGCPMPVAP